MTKAKTPEEKTAAKAAKAEVQPKTKTTAKKAKNTETKFVSSAGKNGRVKSFSM
jgi:hypothetical protein